MQENIEINEKVKHINNPNWNEELGYKLWVICDPHPKDFKDFKEYIDKADSNLEVNHMKKLLDHINDKDLYEKVFDYFMRSDLLLDVKVKTKSTIAGWEDIKKENPKYSISNYDIRDLILEIYYIKNIETSNELVLYEDGIYLRKQKDKIINTIIANTLQALEERFSYRRAIDILKLIQGKTTIPINNFDKDPYILNLKNGLLNIRNQNLIFTSHDPYYLSFRRISIEYKVDMTCPTIDAFLKSVFEEEDIKFIEEFCGLCLTPIMEYQRFLMLFGTGNNGKTTFISLLSCLLGIINVSVIDPSTKTDKSEKALLEGKLLNCKSDISHEGFFDIDYIKLYVGNELQLTINQKYIMPYTVNPTAKLLFSCNETFPRVPKSADKGFWRKTTIIECTRVFDKVEDIFILKNLIHPNELSGFLNKTIAGFQRLEARQRFEGKYNNWEANRDLWYMKTSELDEFLNEYGELGDNFVANKDETLNKFNEWKKKKGKSSVRLNSLTRLVKSHPNFDTMKYPHNISYKNEQYKINIINKRPDIYIGFKLKDSSFPQIKKIQDTLLEHIYDPSNHKKESFIERLKELFEENNWNPIERKNIVQNLAIFNIEEEFSKTTIEELINNGVLYEPKPNYVKFTLKED